MNVGNRIRLLGGIATVAMVGLVALISHHIGVAKNDVSNNLAGNVIPTYQVLLVMQRSFQTAQRDLLLGETGHGFAVVADEVRKLAERTSGSTQEILAPAGTIQHEAAQTVMTMKNTVSEVELGVTKAQGALDAIVQIRQSTEQVKNQVEDISVATREQSAASNSMAQEVEKWRRWPRRRA